MSASPKPIILIPLLCAVASLGVVIIFGRSSLFVPHAWLNAAQPLVWLGVSVLTIAAIAVRMHFIRDPQNSFSKHSLLFIVASLGLGFLAQEVASGAASLLNRFGAEQRIQCFVLVAYKANPSGNIQRVMNADIRLPGDDAQRSRRLQYTPGSADLSQLKAGDAFELRVLDGTFGYTALRGQRPSAGCSGQSSVR
ncbi:TPA: hypothetical protein ACOEBE_000038 [Stenotrophomonas maltophilia]